MTPLFKKLNLKDTATIVVLHAPASFEPELDALTDVTIHRTPEALDAVPFALTFVTTQDTIDAAVAQFVPKATEDPIWWFAYPKQRSKRYTCDFNRDTGWAALGDAGFEPVRQVAIDEDWSALRFRRVEQIQTMRRDPSRALTAEGRARTEGG